MSPMRAMNWVCASSSASVMLASNMVTEPAQRQEYLETMCAESERLSHLVENVLAYSRLERGHLRGNVAEFTPAELIAHGESRLRRRCRRRRRTGNRNSR